LGKARCSRPIRRHRPPGRPPHGRNAGQNTRGGGAPPAPPNPPRPPPPGPPPPQRFGRLWPPRGGPPDGRCRRIGREHRAFPKSKDAAFKEGKNSPQRRRVRRGAKAPRPQAGSYKPTGTAVVGARLRAIRQMMPADQTRALRLSREKGCRSLSSQQIYLALPAKNMNRTSFLIE
jgi:hypothetical protein